LVGSLLVCVAALASTAVAQSAHTGPVAPPPSSTARPVPSGQYRLSVPTDTLVAVLREELFTDSGRFYPCRVNTACTSWGNDVVVSQPKISVDGPRIVFSVHMTGTYTMNQFFSPKVAGDLIVSGVPVLHANKVGLTQTSAAAGSASDAAFRTFIELMRPRIESMIDDSPGFDLAQYLASSTADPQLPPPRLPTRGCVAASQIQLTSIATNPGPPQSVGARVVVAPLAASAARQHC